MVPGGSDKLSKNDKLREFKLSGSDCMKPKLYLVMFTVKLRHTDLYFVNFML